MNKFFILSLIAVALLLTSVLSTFDLTQTAEAKKSEGVLTQKYGSKLGKVCGDRLCSETEANVPKYSSQAKERTSMQEMEGCSCMADGTCTCPEGSCSCMADGTCTCPEGSCSCMADGTCTCGSHEMTGCSCDIDGTCTCGSHEMEGCSCMADGTCTCNMDDKKMDHSMKMENHEERKIKSFSNDELEELKAGHGIGMAKIAELNGYPGPRHVLELAAELNLTPDQKFSTEKLYEEMQSQSIPLQKELIAIEKKLNDKFASNTITSQELSDLVQQSSEIQGKARNVHLQFHLQMADILSDDQITKYSELRSHAHSDHDMKMDHEKKMRHDGCSCMADGTCTCPEGSCSCMADGTCTCGTNGYGTCTCDLEGNCNCGK